MTAVRLDERHCSYRCPHFQMGAPSARCNKYDEAVAFSRHGKPRLMPECAAEAEREACALLCDELEQHWSDYKDTALLNGDVELSNAASGEPRAARAIAAAIRARGAE